MSANPMLYEGVLGVGTYGKLSNLCVIHSEDLGFLARAEMAAGDEVDEEENYAGAAEGVDEARS